MWLILGIVCWTLWLMRNKYFFEGIVSAPQEAFHFARTLHKDVSAIWPINTPRIIPGIQRNFLSRLVTAVRWYYPEGSSLVLNVDDLFLGNHSLAGIGYVLRDSNSVRIAKSIPKQCESSLHVEFEAMLVGLEDCQARYFPG